MNKIRRYWSLSLLVTGLSSATIAFFNMIEMQIPDLLLRCLGLITLISLPVLIYTTIKLWLINKKK